jgi:hypothetical protein
MRYVRYRGKTMVALEHPPIDVPLRAVPYIAGTQTEVVEAVRDRLAHHTDHHVHAAPT